MLRPVSETAYGEGAAKSYDADRFTLRSGFKVHQVELGMVLEATHVVHGESRLLEVGCGTGRLLVELCKAGFRVNGIDPSPYMLGQCRAKVSSQFPATELVVSEAGKLPYHDNSYDFVYSVRVLNIVGSAAYSLDVITEMVRVAKPGGYILVEFMNLFRPRIGRRRDRGVRLRPKQVVQRASECGARVVWSRGAFFFGMTALHKVPDFLLGPAAWFDRLPSRLFPRLCSRGYILFHKCGAS